MKTIQEYFKDDATRARKFTMKIDIGEEFIVFDYSKTHLTSNDIRSYEEEFRKKKLVSHISGMFAGGKTNFTEDRKVLHTLLRNKDILEKIKKDDSANLHDEKKDIYYELIKMRELSNSLSSKMMKGATGKVIDTIVNIGIGGSDLGPKMVCEALQFYRVSNTSVHFISNVDATETFLVFEKIDPEKTLFVVVSKTFTTHETLANAKLAKAIFMKKTGLKEEKITKHHFVAVSSNVEEVKKFGIETIFNMWDFVGGRYSLWSAGGLSICLYIGFENFIELLQGGSIMDEHFKTQKVFSNIPLFQAIVELYYNDMGYNNKCILPYDSYLSHFPSYFQQAEMESNGKTATKSGEVVQDTGMIIWGEVGTNAQHSFFQLIHQGTRKILCEFLCAINPVQICCELRLEHQKVLFANCIAQTEALMVGKTNENKHKHFEGNKPSITTIYSKLTPAILGSLIAMYEHKIFCQGIYWDINSFDQFGVELGKVLAKTIIEDIKDGDEALGSPHDESTSQVLRLFTENIGE